MATTKTFRLEQTYNVGLKAWMVFDDYSERSDGKYNDVYSLNADPGGGRFSYSAIITLDLSEIPRSAQITSVNLANTIQMSSQLYSSTWITLPDISGSGSINARILSYLQQTPHPTALRIEIHASFVSTYTRVVSSLDSVGGLDDTYPTRTLQKAIEELVVIYEGGDASTISFGVNNTWQRCNVYYGTGGEWKQCKAHFGSDGSWKETQ